MSYMHSTRFRFVDEVNSEFFIPQYTQVKIIEYCEVLSQFILKNF